MKKLFYIYIAFPLFLIYGGGLVGLWSMLNFFLLREFEHISILKLYHIVSGDDFYAFMYLSFCIIALYILFPKIVSALSKKINYFEAKSKIFTRIVFLMLQFSFVCIISYMYYYYTRKHDCTGLLYPGNCGCYSCAFKTLLCLYTWIIFYAFISESIYNLCEKYIPDFVFKFDKKFIIIIVLAVLSVLLGSVLKLNGYLKLSLNFDLGDLFYIFLLLPIIYIIACGYNAFLTKLERRGKITNMLLILAFALFPYLFPFLFCILDYILRKKNIKIAHLN